MNYADIKPLDITNGEGIRVSLFVSGCTHGCHNCFNKDLWSFSYGKKFTNETMNDILTKVGRPQIEGFSLLGGEPLHLNNVFKCTEIVENIRERYPQKDIWVWSGYLWEDIIDNKYQREILKYIDVLVDGKFEQDKADLTYAFAGSTNQRLIDVRRSLKENKVILYELGRK